MDWHWLFHDWDKWVEIERGDVEVLSRSQPDRPARKVGSYVRQKRTCKTCGKMQLNHVQREGN